VRDIVLGETPKDYDVATDAAAAQVARLFEKTAPTGEKYGTVTVLAQEGGVEVTTYRRESGYEDFRHPALVEFSRSICQDLSRRDFTVNAMAAHERHGLCDPYGGLEDIQNRLIRAVRDPKERFFEDPLRIMRAVRFASVLDFDIDPATMSAIIESCGLLRHISAERIACELFKTLRGKKPEWLAVLINHGGLAHLGLHTAQNLQRLTGISALSDGYIFAAFCRLCSADSLNAAKLLKLSNRQRGLAAECRKLMALPLPQNTPEVKRQLGRLKLCDYFCVLQTRRVVLLEDVAFARRAAEDILQRRQPVTVAQLNISGDDLRETGLEGKDIGDALQSLLEHCLEHPEDNTASRLKELANREK